MSFEENARGLKNKSHIQEGEVCVFLTCPRTTMPSPDGADLVYIYPPAYEFWSAASFESNSELCHHPKFHAPV